MERQPPNTIRLSAESVLQEYQVTKEWIRSLNIGEPNATRYGKYDGFVRRLIEAQNKGLLNDFETQNINSILHTFYEIDSINFLRKAFDKKEIPGLSSAIQKLLHGPETYLDENENSNEARNIGFELSTAASILNAGFPIDIDSIYDIKTNVLNTEVYIECKRPQNMKRLIKRTNEAIVQLEKRLALSTDQNAIGIVMISLDKILNPSMFIREFKNDNEFTRFLSELTNQLASYLTHKLKQDWNPRILAVTSQIRVPVRLQDDGIRFGYGSFTRDLLFPKSSNADQYLFKYYREKFLMGWNRRFHEFPSIPTS